MIKTVTFEKTTYNDLPFKFEAGTPDMAGMIGLGAAIRYVQGLGLGNIEEAEQEVMEHALEVLREIEGFRLVGGSDAHHRAGVISFLVGISILSILGRYWISRGLRFGRGITVPSPLWTGIVFRGRCGLRWRCIIPGRKWIGWRRGYGKSG